MDAMRECDRRMLPRLNSNNAQQQTPQRTAISESALATQLDISQAALRKWRSQGKGPRFVRLGRCVRYLVADVEAWLNA
jgi:predicted DNA-binding transcriptional regulator AlpA